MAAPRRVRRRRLAPLPPRSRAEVLEAFPHLRQSLLADFDNCRLTTRFGLEVVGYSNRAQARGILFHRFAAELLRTLRRTGETMVPVAEALEILYEVCAQRDVPDEEVVTAPAAERRLLRIAVVTFCARNEFRMDRLIDVERRLHATVRYPDPAGGAVERVLTGTPDALVADPDPHGDPDNDGAVVLDWKTTLQPPPRYEPRTNTHPDHPHGVSYMGYFQQRTYALLVMREYPAVQRVTLREFYVLADEARTATVYRHQLEHVERELAGLAEQLDRALAGGSASALWQPSPGRHCSYCPRPLSCPIDPEVRVTEGGVVSRAEAERLAAHYHLADTARGMLREALKAAVDTWGPLPIKSAKGRAELGWHQQRGGGRRFGVGVPEESDRGPEDEDLAAAFEEAAARRSTA